MKSQRELARCLKQGHTSGRASNMEIKQLPNGNYGIVGYGWAIYAERKQNGETVLYNGWRGYSVSTSCQLTQIRRYIDTVNDTDENPKFA